MESICIFLVDDQLLMLECLSHIIGKQLDMKVVAQAETPNEALNLIASS